MTIVALLGCRYEGGTYRAPITGAFAGTHVPTGGCLDLSISAGRDPQAQGPVVVYAFGNRCDHRVLVDLASVRVATFDRMPLVAYDPRHEIRPLAIHARWWGGEAIEYAGAPPDARVCVDAGGIDGSAPHREQWVCP